MPLLRRTNRRAFGAVDANAAPLLQLYCKLVAIELALKDLHGRTAFPLHRGHDFVHALRNVAPPYPPAVHNVLTPLDMALRRLRREGRDLDPGKYPELRYLDHADDHHPVGTTDDELREALRLTMALIRELNTHWRGLPTPQEAVVP